MSLILIVDDDPSTLKLLQAMLSLDGYRVLQARDGREALALLNDDVDLLITDLIMPNKEGLETIAEVRRQGFDKPIIAMTAGGLIGPREYLATARFIGANAVVAKPFSRADIMVPVRGLLAPEQHLDQAESTISA